MMHYLDFDRITQSYKIISTLRNVDRKKMRILHGVPVDDDDLEFHMKDSYSLHGLVDINDSSFDINKYFTNFRWDDNTTFRMINTSGIEKVF